MIKDTAVSQMTRCTNLWNLAFKRWRSK